MPLFSVLRQENVRHGYRKLEEEARILQCLLDTSMSVS